jgi:hypothetical protein
LRRGTWQETVLKSRQAVRKVGGKEALALAVWKRVEQDFPVEWDWAMQDGGNDFHRWFFEETVADRERKMIERLLPGEWENSRGGDERQRLDRYVRACEQRRATRLEKLRQRWPKIVFTKHYNLGGWHYAYTEDLSFTDPKWVFFTPGSALCVLDLSDGRGTARTLLEDPDGVIRDPDVSHDGKRILFAWKKNLKTDDYHLYELDIESGRTRQITSGVGVADYEGAYLPNGDIVFNSTRCFQVVDCAGQFVSNLYTCDANGKYLRRLSFDQVHTTYPTVTHDGRVLYTRWDYNDRSNQPIQALFQMNPDGTTQTEFYGNNSWFPTTILHARLIPGSQKAVAILSGHHSLQKGKLAWIDPTRGRQETIGVTMGLCQNNMVIL